MRNNMSLWLFSRRFKVSRHGFLEQIKLSGGMMGGGGGGRKGAEWPKTENSEIASEFEPGTLNELYMCLNCG